MRWEPLDKWWSSSYLPQIDAFISLSVTQQSMHACSNVVLLLILIRKPIPLTSVFHEGMKDTHASLHLWSECVTCRSNQPTRFNNCPKIKTDRRRYNIHIIACDDESPHGFTVPSHLTFEVILTGLFGLHFVLPPCLLLLLSSSGHMRSTIKIWTAGQALLGIWDPAINKQTTQIAR